MPIGFGYTITDILNIWADYGVFAYALPFLLIFAIVFGILSKTDILGKNKGVQATIALAVGLLSLQFDYVTNFYATIFPYAGIGISILLVAISSISKRIPSSISLEYLALNISFWIEVINSCLASFALMLNKRPCF